MSGKRIALLRNIFAVIGAVSLVGIGGLSVYIGLHWEEISSPVWTDTFAQDDKCGLQFDEVLDESTPPEKLSQRDTEILNALAKCNNRIETVSGKEFAILKIVDKTVVLRLWLDTSNPNDLRFFHHVFKVTDGKMISYETENGKDTSKLYGEQLDKMKEELWDELYYRQNH